LLIQNSRRERVFEDCSAFKHLMNSPIARTRQLFSAANFASLQPEQPSLA
jgi:hypothetical protein